MATCLVMDQMSQTRCSKSSVSLGNSDCNEKKPLSLLPVDIGSTADHCCKFCQSEKNGSFDFLALGGLFFYHQEPWQ